MIKTCRYVIICGLCALISACSGNVRETLGLKQNAPDEFRVISKPPLSVPPNFSLRPPASRANGLVTTVPQEARRLLISEGNTSVQTKRKYKNVSESEGYFLSQAGVETANPDIKRLLQKEQEEKGKDEGFVDNLLKEKKSEVPDPVVDAAEESKRIKETMSKKEPVTGEGTPTVDAGKQGILNKIFGRNGS